MHVRPLRDGSRGAGSATGRACGMRRALVLDSPNASATDMRAQHIRVTAVSGCSTRAAQPKSPNTRMAAAIACRTCPALGSSDRCSAEANSASARTALILRLYVADSIGVSSAGSLPSCHLVRWLSGGLNSIQPSRGRQEVTKVHARLFGWVTRRGKCTPGPGMSAQRAGAGGSARCSPQPAALPLMLLALGLFLVTVVAVLRPTADRRAMVDRLTVAARYGLRHGGRGARRPPCNVTAVRHR